MPPFLAFLQPLTTLTLLIFLTTYTGYATMTRSKCCVSRREFVLVNWDMVSALSTIAAAVATSTIGLTALFLSLNPEWIADIKLLKRISKEGKLRDVCLSICLSRCGYLTVHSDLAPCIIVKPSVGQLGLISKSHLYVSDSYRSEVEELVSSGLLKMLEEGSRASVTAGAYAGYQITGEWLRLSKRIENRLVRYQVGENLFSYQGAFIDEFASAKVNSLYTTDILCAFPDVEVKGNRVGVSVRFVPVTQIEDDEFAIAYFPGHGYDFGIEFHSMRFQPISRPVNLGESQFYGLQGRLTASIVSVKEYIDSDNQPMTRVGLRYTNSVLNA